jgi:hypothetical protein
MEGGFSSRRTLVAEQPDFGKLAIGARGATQVRGKDSVHPEIVQQLVL